MTTRFSILCGCAIAHAALGVASASALHPVVGHEMELVPELSSLIVTDGIAGVHHTYQVEGTLTPIADFSPHEPDDVEAAFLHVDATLRGEGFLDGEDLNDLLRMTDWRGSIVDEDPLTTSFTGTDAQEAPIASVAEFPGVWLRVRGENEPGCCDFFNYSWDLFALRPRAEPGRPHADFNGDGGVDGHDLLDALLGFGMEAGATRAAGDADGDGDVDRMDIRIWRATVGSGIDPHSVGTIPEPSGIVLVFLSVAILAWHWKRCQ